MGLYLYIFKINGDFSQKLQIFHTSRVFNAPIEGVTLKLGTSVFSINENETKISVNENISFSLTKTKMKIKR